MGIRPSHDPAFPGMDHDHHNCVELALDRAAAVCRRHGTRLTELRGRVLELIWSGHRPLGAYDILDLLRHERRGAAPPTVYRALDFLLEQGLVHRIESRNSFVGCCSPGVPHRGQFLICQSCGSTAEINDSRIDEVIGETAAEAGFKADRKTIEVEGLCPHCQSNEGIGEHG